MKRFRITITDLYDKETLVDTETDGILGSYLLDYEEDCKQMLVTNCSGYGLVSLIKSTENIETTAKKQIIEKALDTKVADIFDILTNKDKKE